MPETLTETHTCKACSHVFSGRYCNQCGEKVYTDHDKSVVHFLEEGVHFITHFEGKFFTTLKAILGRPGQLSTDYCHGIRNTYFRPVSFFLLLVVLYLLFPLFSGLNMPLMFYTSQPLYGTFAREQISAYLTAHPTLSLGELEALFAAKSEKTSKVLLFAIIPLFALLPWALLAHRRRFFFDHLIFSTEFNSFFLLFGFLFAPLLVTLYNSLSRFIFQAQGSPSEYVLTVLIYTVLSVFLAQAVRRFYNVVGWQRVGVVAGLLAWHNVVVYICYKFLLFVTTFALV